MSNSKYYIESDKAHTRRRIDQLIMLGFKPYAAYDFSLEGIWFVYREQIARGDDKEWQSYVQAIAEAAKDKGGFKNHINYAKVTLDSEGLLECHICGLSFRKLAAHTVQKHLVTAEDYKKMFGLYAGKGLVTDELRQTLSDNVDPRVIKKNLINKGKQTRYRNGHKGRTTVRPQLKEALKARLETPEMKKAMRESGKRVGKSGLGNKTRWNHKSENDDRND